MSRKSFLPAALSGLVLAVVANPFSPTPSPGRR